MNPKIIKTEAERAATLVRIEKIFNAAPGTPDGDELELLSMLVAQYEREAFPIDLPDPLAAIRFRMEQQGLEEQGFDPIHWQPQQGVGSVVRPS